MEKRAGCWWLVDGRGGGGGGADKPRKSRIGGGVTCSRLPHRALSPRRWPLSLKTHRAQGGEHDTRDKGRAERDDAEVMRLTWNPNQTVLTGSSYPRP